MRENRPSGLEGGVAVTRHPYPYFLSSIQWLEDVFLIMLDRVPLQEPNIFVAETLKRMMAFLVANVIDHSC